MTRFVAALVAGLVTVHAAAAADAPKKITIRWHGQSFFEIVSRQGTRIVTDPHAIEGYGKITVPADLVLISHLHTDHSQVDGVIENKDKAHILVGMKGPGPKADWNPIDETFKDVHVRTVGVYHDNVKGAERGKNSVFVIEVDGLRVVHLGDLGHLLTVAQLKEIGPVDVLMIPVGGIYTLNGEEAKKVVEQLKPRQYILPMHYATPAFEDLLPATEFLEDQKNVKRLADTNELVVDSDFKPAEPVIVVLGWKKGAAETPEESK